MAEILLSLTIIGVVAAITLPSLTGNINERTWNTQRKALYSRFSQAVSLMPALNGYGTLDDTDSQKVTETFITSGLSKVLKINNICADNLQDCGIPAQMQNANGTKIDTPVKIADLYAYNTRIGYIVGDSSLADTPDINGVGFETANGESILAFYNPKCNAASVFRNNNFAVPEKVCANFIYDLNGKKGPNTFGKDIGIITAFYPTDSVVVAPMPFLRGGQNEIAFDEANSYCKTLDSEYRAPNFEEMMALVYNLDVVNLTGERYWTNTKVSATKAWLVSTSNRAFMTNLGSTGTEAGTFSNTIICVQR